MPAYHFQRIEQKWQALWEREQTFRTPDFVAGKPKLYILDMFPYPSGDGLHVGHPEGYTATDILCRYKRMRGFNVLHPMGWDAFGLPAEQFAIKTGTHPRVTTQKNINNFRRQIKSLGFSYDWSREVDTTDPAYAKWTQWIFLQIFDTWYDPDYRWTDAAGRSWKGKGRPIGELPIPAGVDADDYRDSQRLAFRAEVPVNWCPKLGTVLANEEVVDGKSEVGGYPVVRMPLRQWMLRITSYADRLVDDLEFVDWPRSIKDMQRNWVGRSEGALVDFRSDEARKTNFQRTFDSTEWREVPDPGVIRVFTTRPDTLFGATYMVLAPEHPLVDRLTTPDQKGAVDAYRQATASKSDLDRTEGAKTKTGVFTGGYAFNPVNGREIPIWIADYVLMGYGTGAIMAVPAHDERDFEFAKVFRLPIHAVVMPDDDWLAKHRGEIAETDANALRELYLRDPGAFSEAFTGSGAAVNSRNDSVTLDGMPMAEAKATITGYLESEGIGKKTVTTKLRDWLFSRQRYWGEPFPILLDQNDRAHAVPESELPVTLPELADFQPSGKPEPPLGKATDWVNYSDTYRRETNTMPQWAGSCWYYLRYIDPKNDAKPWDPELEKAWMPVDLYVGGAEHAVLHLLYSRFWHKVLFDRGFVSTPEPFQRLVNQGMILGEMEFTGYRDAEGKWASASDVSELDGGGHVARKKGESAGRDVQPVKLQEADVVKAGEGFVLASDPGIRTEARTHKMSKSRGNVINPDTVVAEYGADSLRLYEMFMGPLEAVKPWSMKGVEGVYRFLGRAWRMIVDHEADEVALDPRVRDVEPTEEQAKIVARTVAGVAEDYDALRFNTAISKLMEFTNFFTGQETRPKSAMEAFVLILAPMAPHIAEELWELLGYGESLAYAPWPEFDPALLKDDVIEVPVQVNGKLRARISIPAEADAAEAEALARADEKVATFLEGKTTKKVIVVPGKLINFVVAG